MRKGTCIHYEGLPPFSKGCNGCKLGVDLREAFDQSRLGIFLRLPCVTALEKPASGPGTYIRAGAPSILEPLDRRGQEMMPCPLGRYEEPTEEAVQAYRAETDAMLARVDKALVVAREWRTPGRPEQDRAEAVTCPCCGGRLNLTQSSHNGHVHGKCETEGCVSWME